MRDVDIVGAGITPFGKHPDATMSSLAATAIGAALADAGLPASEVDLLVVRREALLFRMEVKDPIYSPS